MFRFLPTSIFFNQDKKYGGPATPYKCGVNYDWIFSMINPAEYWSGQSTGGTLVLALNSLDTDAKREIKWDEVPHLEKGSGAFEVTDVWSGKNLGCVERGISKTLAPHDTMVFVVGRKCAHSSL
jgi:alpha-galactosidase